jgi:uncharacterized protein YbcC (UPF0753/DUF2309 family)
MTTAPRARYTESRRAELGALVKLAGEVVAPLWPLRTAIAINPLLGFERLDFEEAELRARQVWGGRGYLPNNLYREYARLGRIRRDHVDAALRPLVRDQHVMIGGRRITHLEVLRAHLLHGVTAPAMETLEALIETVPERQLLVTLMERLSPVIESQPLDQRMQAEVQADRAALGRAFTLAGWCDRALGTKLWEQINGQVIKWCAAFLDEGQAAWAMPERGLGLYGTWKRLAPSDVTLGVLGIADWWKKLAELPDHAEDAVIESLGALGLPEAAWEDYLALHVAALPGWAGHIKWRAEQPEPVSFEWVKAYPVNLVQYLAIRLWYERELVVQVCRRELGLEGTYGAFTAYMQRHPRMYYLRRERQADRLSREQAREVDRLRYGALRHGLDAWEALWERYVAACQKSDHQRSAASAAWRLLRLAQALEVEPSALLSGEPLALKTVLDWFEAFPETEHGPRWLEALEAGYREPLLAQLAANGRKLAGTEAPLEVRPQAQAVFCIDARSECYRRHLEEIGHYETLGFAGFFICFIRYRPFGRHHDINSFPVIMKARNHVREIPRSVEAFALPRYRARASLFQALKELVHDLKENVITPYVMVESLGWFYSLPFVGKCVAPARYRQALSRLRERLVPMVATTLTIDKLSKQEAQEMVAAEQRAIIRRALRERLGWSGAQISSELIETLRRHVSQEPEHLGRPVGSGLPAQEEAALIEALRRDYGIDRHWAAARLQRITFTGLTLDEQAFTVEFALRMMGLVRNFGRLVAFVGHGSTVDNDPYEAALECGACGGNDGQPNARLLAAMANRPQVRERLRKNGLWIPEDTHFLSGQINTCTDEVGLFDLEDVPPTHRKDLMRLLEDLGEARLANNRERVARLPDVTHALPPTDAVEETARRSADWSQVRAEWGLANNAAVIVGRRQLTQGLVLDGRTFLHSYDWREDPELKALEIILTAPGQVMEWINLGYYFSTVHNEVFGSGSKIYHNVVGRLGVMYGTQSDLRIGLSWQSCFIRQGEPPYHEPMRLLLVVEAPRSRIDQLIRRHAILQRFYDNRWVHLVALDPEEGALYRYQSKQGWVPASERV